MVPSYGSGYLPDEMLLTLMTAQVVDSRSRTAQGQLSHLRKQLQALNTGESLLVSSRFTPDYPSLCMLEKSLTHGLGASGIGFGASQPQAGAPRRF